MKNKALLFIIIISFSLLFSLFYVIYYSLNLYAKNFDEKVDVEVFKKYKNKKETFCYGNKLRCKKIKYKVIGMVDTKKVGIYKIKYQAKYKDLKISKIKIIKVVDRVKPKLDLEGTFTNVCPNGKNDNVKITANDNYDGDISSKVKYKMVGNKIEYKVSDSSGNTTKKKFDVTILDNEKPNIILNGGNTIYLGENKEYKEPGYVATDNCDGDITKKVVVAGTVNTKKAGNYEIIYRVLDERNNETIIKRIVKVFKTNNYKPGEIGAKTIYLTFDDGPGPYTEKLLEILAKYNVKATFFVTGYNNNYNHLLKRENDEGHTVALHSYTHDYKVIYTSVEAYMDDLLKVQNKVKEYAGIESKIIRFPGGSSNTISRRYKMGIMSELTSKVEELGFRYFDWTILSGDAGNTKDPNKIVENVTGNIKEGEVNVVLMHDIKSYTVDSVERIIEYGLANGYTFAPLTMDSPVVHDKVNN